MKADNTKAVAHSASSPIGERESPRGAPGTPSKVLARRLSSLALGADSGDDDGGLGDLIVKIHGSRTHAYTDGLLEYRLEVAPAQLVHLASAGIQGLRKPADTTYDVLPSESEDSSEVDDEYGDAGTRSKKKRRGSGTPPEPESHLRVWMPACIVQYVLPDLVDRYEVALEAKRAKKSKPKAPRSTAKASVAKGKGKPPSVSRQTVQARSRPTDDEECFDLDVSSSGESDGRSSPTPLLNHSRTLPATSSRDTTLPQLHQKKPDDDVFTGCGMLPRTGVLDPISVGDDNGDDSGPSKTRTHHHLSSPSKVLQRLDQNLKILNMFAELPSKARPLPVPVPAPSSFSPSPCVALRPFPIAFEEGSSDNGRDVPDELTSSSYRQDQHFFMQCRAAAPGTPPPVSSWHGRPLPAAVTQSKGEEEEEESSDDPDPDTMLAELPVFRSSSSGNPQGQQQLRRTTGNSQSDDLPPVHRGDDDITTSDVPDRHNQHSRQQLIPSSSPSSKVVRTNASRDDNNLPLPTSASASPDHRRRRLVSERPSSSSSSSSSIISISTDNDNDDDNDSLQTLAPAPLLIARSRSRSVVSKRLAAVTSVVDNHRRQQRKNIEHEVIDLT